MNCSDENKGAPQTKPSGIRPPAPLAELSNASSNSRPSDMGPPPNTSKRKFDAEGQGEPSRSGPSSRPANSMSNKSLIAKLAPQMSLSKPAAGRAAVGNNSLCNGVAPDRRGFHNQNDRPQSATSNSRTQRTSSSQNRPNSSSDRHPRPPKGYQRIGNKGRISFPSNPLQENKSPVKPESIGCYDPQIYCDLDWESPCAKGRNRDFTVISALKGLTANGKTTPIVDMNASSTPSQIPLRASTHSACTKISSPSKSPKKALSQGRFLTRDSNTPAAWDTEDRFENMETRFSELKEIIGGATSEGANLKDMIAIYKTKANELESMRTQLTANNDSLQKELDIIKTNLRTSATALEDSKRFHLIEIDDLQREHRRELEETSRRLEEETRQMKREHVDAVDAMNRLQRRLEHALEDEAQHRRTEMERVARENELYKQRAESELDEQRKAFKGLEIDLASAREEMSREKALNNDLRVKLSEAGSQSISLEVSMRSLRAQIEFLESDNKSQSNAFVDLETRLQNALRATAEANEKLRKEESLRRKLHNQVQELKGNIRVFCRVRPALESDSTQEVARISYPDTAADSKEVEVLGPDEKSSLGNITNKRNAFSFDRVFRPSSANAEIFDEISQLVQSALDGYNVCIFCYGQTGSGKTYTMSAEDGMIPRAVRQIYDTAKSLEEKGWKYSMEGSFIEVYNENLNDLLGKADEFDKKKHEIRHDVQNCKTTITDITTVDLDTPNKVESILHHAAANRSVAATKANERSSRSHSVFILKLVGRNGTTGEKSEGTLNLVDLAGSERLSHSKATGDRLKETQNINKSLSCLGDVIGALGQGKEGGHVPYRNSKLTYLLQFSLGGNSKTLMFVMISPLQSHLSETLTSLKFATKVHNTHIGTAKRQAKVGNL